MKRLVQLPLDPEQHKEIVRVLEEARIDYREVESPSRLLSSDAIWVADEDFAQARALIQAQADAFAAQRRGEWQTEWTSAHAQSYAHWFWSRLRERPAETLLKFAALLALIGLVLIYPMSLLL